MKKALPVVLGSVLILMGLVLLLGYRLRLQTGLKHCARAVSQMEAILPPGAEGVPDPESGAAMPALEIEGKDYVALLEIPAYGLSLPVAEQWDSGKLYDGPALYYGSAYGGHLVIGGMDHPSQFGFCSQIGQGAEITVTDMTGKQFTYRVTAVGRAKKAENSWLLQGESHLTLFCHDVYAMEYVAVRCERIYKK